MTKQEQNDLIISHIDTELKDTPDVQERVGIVFRQWFQSLLVPPAPPVTEENEQEEAA